MNITYPGKNLPVCVTGGGGYIGSWLVKTLLQNGYTVHATLRDPGNSDKSSCLLALPGAHERLGLFKADLVHERLGLLNSCVRAESVRRVVHTSSITAASCTETPKDPIDESCWSSIDFLRNDKSFGWFYSLSKTLSEQAALQFGRENHIEVVSIVPSIVAGPWITKTVPSSVEATMSLITGHQPRFELLKFVESPTKSVALVHIEDVCNAHVYLMEQPVVEERYICSAHTTTIAELADFISKRYPLYNIAARYEDLASAGDGAGVQFSSKKLLELGFRYKYGLDEIIDHTVQYFQKLGMLS